MSKFGIKFESYNVSSVEDEAEECTCADPEVGLLVMDYLSGYAGDEDRAAVTNHLRWCLFCREEVEGWAKLAKKEAQREGRSVHPAAPGPLKPSANDARAAQGHKARKPRDPKSSRVFGDH